LKKKAVRLDLSPSGDQDLIDDIARVANGADGGGKITESIMRRIFDKSDVEQIPASQLEIRLGGGLNPNGFDHVLVKRNANGGLIDVAIFESKNKNPSVTLNEIKSRAIVQMQEGWPTDVVRRMREPGQSPEVRAFGNELKAYIDDGNTFKLKVSAVDRTSHEVWIMNLGEGI